MLRSRLLFYSVSNLTKIRFFSGTKEGQSKYVCSLWPKVTGGGAGMSESDGQILCLVPSSVATRSVLLNRAERIRPVHIRT